MGEPSCITEGTFNELRFQGAKQPLTVEIPNVNGVAILGKAGKENLLYFP